MKSDYDLTAGGEITLDILIDHSSVEVLFFDGQYSLTNLVYFDEASNGIEIWASDEKAVSVSYLTVDCLSKSMDVN